MVHMTFYCKTCDKSVKKSEKTAHLQLDHLVDDKGMVVNPYKEDLNSVASRANETAFGLAKASRSDKDTCYPRPSQIKSGHLSDLDRTAIFTGIARKDYKKTYEILDMIRGELNDYKY